MGTHLRLVRRALVLLTLATALPAAAAEAPGTVGLLGGAANIDVVGNASFTTADIRGDLGSDLELQYAAGPAMPLDAYVETVRRRVVEGYRYGGFRSATARAAVDRAAGRVRVTVTEGPRYRAGPVRVEGAKAVPADRLAGLLVARKPVDPFEAVIDPAAGTVVLKIDPGFYERARPIAWRPGEPATFDPISTKSVIDAIRTSLAELGFFRAQFRIDTPLNAPADGAADGVAPLVVEMREEGPRATVGSVELVGVKLNEPEAVLKLVGLKRGAPADLTALRAAQQRVWESGRFAGQMLSAKVDADTGETAVRLELLELPEAPLLGKPWSVEEAALQRFGAWLNALADSDEEVLVEAQVLSGPWEIGVAMAAGMRAGGAGRFQLRAVPPAAQARPATVAATRPAADLPPADAPGWFGIDPGAAPDRVRLIDAAVVGGAGGFKVIAPQERQWADAARAEMMLQLNFAFLPEPKPDGSPGWNMRAGTGYRAQNRFDPPGRIVDARIGVAPVAMTYVAHVPEYRAAVRDGVLTLDAGGKLLRVDAATGRMIDFRGTDDWGRYRVSFGKGKLAAATEAVNRIVPPGKPPAPEGVFGAVGRAAVVRALAGRATDLAQYQAAAAAVDAVLALDAVEPLRPALDGLVSNLAGYGRGDPGARFRTPVDPARIPPKTPSAPIDFANAFLPLVDDLLPRGGWPWAVVRFHGFVWFGRPAPAAARDLGRLANSPEPGPIGCLVLSRHAAEWAPAMARPFASAGLGRLDAEGFRRDVAAVTGDPGPLGEVVRRAAARLRDLPPEQVDALAAVMDEDAAAALKAIVADLRKRKAEPIDAALAGSLDAAWDAAVKHEVAARLKAALNAKPKD